LYDITNVLEGIGLIKKRSKNTIAWLGTESAAAVVAAASAELLGSSSQGVQSGRDSMEEITQTCQSLETELNELHQQMHSLEVWIDMLRTSLLTDEKYLFVTVHDLMVHLEDVKKMYDEKKLGVDPTTAGMIDTAASATTTATKHVQIMATKSGGSNNKLTSFMTATALTRHATDMLTSPEGLLTMVIQAPVGASVEIPVAAKKSNQGSSSIIISCRPTAMFQAAMNNRSFHYTPYGSTPMAIASVYQGNRGGLATVMNDEKEVDGKTSMAGKKRARTVTLPSSSSTVPKNHPQSLTDVDPSQVIESKSHHIQSLTLFTTKYDLSDKVCKLNSEPYQVDIKTVKAKKPLLVDPVTLNHGETDMHEDYAFYLQAEEGITDYYLKEEGEGV